MVKPRTWPLVYVPDPKTLPEYRPGPALAEDRWSDEMVAAFKKNCRRMDPMNSTDRLNIEAGLCVVVDGEYVMAPDPSSWEQLLGLV